MKENSYKPVSCALYDQYELWGIRRVLLDVRLLDGAQFQGRIQTLETNNSVEYMILESGERIRLDALESVTPAEP